MKEILQARVDELKGEQNLGSSVGDESGFQQEQYEETSPEGAHRERCVAESKGTPTTLTRPGGEGGSRDKDLSRIVTTKRILFSGATNRRVQYMNINGLQFRFKEVSLLVRRHLTEVAVDDLEWNTHYILLYEPREVSVGFQFVPIGL